MSEHDYWAGRDDERDLHDEAERDIDDYRLAISQALAMLEAGNQHDGIARLRDALD
jgi:hypothetical protein